MSNWIKPNGTPLPVNENSAAHARSLGWLPEAEYKAAQEKAKADAEAKAKADADAKAKAKQEAANQK